MYINNGISHDSSDYWKQYNMELRDEVTGKNEEVARRTANGINSGVKNAVLGAYAGVRFGGGIGGAVTGAAVGFAKGFLDGYFSSDFKIVDTNDLYHPRKIN
ncbi:hypothetical protein JCM30566_07790 [Marinitoga arctica]